jgi:hypothetical protein
MQIPRHNNPSQTAPPPLTHKGLLRMLNGLPHLGQQTRFILASMQKYSNSAQRLSRQ